MIRYDTHIHSAYSLDSGTPVQAQLDAAVSRGLSGLCITDHMDYSFPPDQFESVLPEGQVPFEFDIQTYEKELSELRQRYPDLDILTGVECGLQTRLDVLDKNRELSNNPDLDYIIGSLHLTGRQDPYYPKFWENRDPSACIRQYLEELYDNLCAFTGFDSLGHLDYIVRYAPDSFLYEPAQYRELTEEILRRLIRSDIALEINTSGYRKGPYPNPHPDILLWYRELGGEMITIGSDEHHPEFVASRFEEASSLLKRTGLHQYVTFHRRRPRFHSLDS